VSEQEWTGSGQRQPDPCSGIGWEAGVHLINGRLITHVGCSSQLPNEALGLLGKITSLSVLKIDAHSIPLPIHAGWTCLIPTHLCKIAFYYDTIVLLALKICP